MSGEVMRALSEATPTTRLFVWTLRRWLDGVAGQQQVWSLFARRLGGREGARALQAFEAHLDSLATGCRRGLQRRHSCCPALGADEAMMAATVRAAGAADLDRAYTLAAAYVVPASLFAVVESAAQLGRALERMGDAPPLGDWPSPAVDADLEPGVARRSAGPPSDRRRLH